MFSILFFLDDKKKSQFFFSFAVHRGDAVMMRLFIAVIWCCNAFTIEKWRRKEWKKWKRKKNPQENLIKIIPNHLQSFCHLPIVQPYSRIVSLLFFFFNFYSRLNFFFFLSLFLLRFVSHFGFAWWMFAIITVGLGLLIQMHKPEPEHTNGNRSTHT